jgi:tetratricopeptide (TPR) repeat protein
MSFPFVQFVIILCRVHCRKSKGNDSYKAKDYRGAVDAYSAAISHNPTNAALYNNRAAAYVMLLQFREAIADCDRCIQLDGSNSKAFFRKSTAYKALGNIDAAVEALNAGLVHDSGNSVAVQDRDNLVASKAKIASVRTMLQNREFRKALTVLDSLLKDIGNNSREVNLLKVECLVELKRTEEAYNLTNQMVYFNGSTTWMIYW